MKMTPDCRRCTHNKVCKGLYESCEFLESINAVVNKFNDKSITCHKWFNVTVECIYQEEAERGRVDEQ